MLIKKTIEVKFIYDTDSDALVSVMPQTNNAIWTVMNGDNEVKINPTLPDAVILCPNDSDTVHDLGPSPKQYHQHKIMENHDGTCDLYCPSTGHAYKHIIKVPNKNELICRGCGKVV
jgi:hypothetical protein